MKSLISRFVKDESGATAIEYGLIAAGLAVVVVGIFGDGKTVDIMLTNMFGEVSKQVTAATGASGS
ncbi:Flp family type IVb pilin [Microvirga sp. BT688]|uniref:Flp family type IVb pilin n=1 Tax=Microvirga sp. TaxID=1873136 RepID=UPI00168A0103|nr:Flp family type IVb pilin [Microvirga sp.]MBD2746517.1 Flp family type IVb pilin [Microvirga sp.]